MFAFSTRIFVCYDCDPENPCILIVPEFNTEKKPICPFNPSIKKWVELKWPPELLALLKEGREDEVEEEADA